MRSLLKPILGFHPILKTASHVFSLQDLSFYHIQIHCLPSSKASGPNKAFHDALWTVGYVTWQLHVHSQSQYNNNGMTLKMMWPSRRTNNMCSSMTSKDGGQICQKAKLKSHCTFSFCTSAAVLQKPDIFGIADVFLLEL